MKKSLIILLSLAFALAQSCTKSEAQYEQIDSPGAVDKISVSLEPARDIDATKSEINEDGLFVWSEGDTLAVYPSVGSQVYFVLENGGGETSATFDGGGWALKDETDYYSYYPFQGDIYLPKDHIPVSYLGQTHTGTVGGPDIGKYDFRYTEKSRSEDGTLSFNYKMLNTVIRFTVTLPAGTYDKLTISSDDDIFTTEGYYDLTAETPAIVTTKTAKNLSVELKDITLTEQTQFKIYMMSAPVAIKDKEVTVTIRTSEGGFMSLTKIPSRNYEAGATNGLSCTEWTENSGPEYVDLGFPSGTLWATCNLGASSPEDYGDYYAWGEIETKENYSLGNYKFYRKYSGLDEEGYNVDMDTYTKYVPSDKVVSYGYDGYSDSFSILLPEDDVAHVKWGSDWRVPTREEYYELEQNCDVIIASKNDVKGKKFTSKINGESIFIPFAGSRQDARYVYRESRIECWTSTLDSSAPSCAYLFSTASTGNAIGTISNSRWQGLPVRPVKGIVAATGVDMDRSSITLPSGVSISRSATVLPSNATYKDIVWSSSNPAVVTVSPSGIITAISEGSAIITASAVIGEMSQKYTVDVVNLPDGAVDLGLSVKWNSCNIGASKPEEVGGYYQWGSTIDVSDTSINLDWDSCPYHTGEDTNTGWTKYIPSQCSSFWSGPGDPDNKCTLDLEDDVAHSINANWHIPTSKEWGELMENCSMIWITYNGVDGCLFTSRKPGFTGKSIFLPAEGCRELLGIYNKNYCYYWSSTKAEDQITHAYCMYTHYYKYSSNYTEFTVAHTGRLTGAQIRPVSE